MCHERGDSVIVVYAGMSGLAWAVGSDTNWTAQGSLDTRPFVAAHPRLRLLPGSDVQLMWTDRAGTYSRVRSADGRWGATDTIACIASLGETFVTAWIDLSANGKRPFAVWSIFGFGTTLRDGMCMGTQVDGKWSTEELPLIPPGEIPAVALDRYGEAWVAWSLLGRGRSYFAHSYVAAAPHIEAIDGDNRSRTVRWRIDAKCPDSMWRVQRRTSNETWADIAVVTARAETTFSSVDHGAAIDSVGYRVVACAEDERFMSASGVQFWKPLIVAPHLQIRGSPVLGRVITLALDGVPDRQVVIEVYDIGGRRVLKKRVAIESGSESVTTFSLPSHLRSGVYLVRVQASVPVPSARAVVI